MKLDGQVVKNLGRGKELGYPTANIHVDAHTPEGVFIAKTQIEGNSELLQSLLFVGVSETFGDKDKWGEVYILDFGEDIYGKRIYVTTLEKLRDNMKFDSKDALINQMKDDEKKAKAYFLDVRDSSTSSK